MDKNGDRLWIRFFYPQVPSSEKKHPQVSKMCTSCGKARESLVSSEHASRYPQGYTLPIHQSMHNSRQIKNFIDINKKI
jgi:hypothetical protein